MVESAKNIFDDLKPGVAFEEDIIKKCIILSKC
jgi:hypothetical protein